MGGTKHANNNTSLGFFTRGEWKKSDWRSRTERVVSHSVKQWDHCTICLNVVEHALVCQSGDLFCKGCVYGYIFSQKAKNQDRKRARKKQVALKAKLEEQNEQKEQIEKFLAFERFESGVVTEIKRRKRRNHIKIQGDDVGMEVRNDRQTVFQEEDDNKINSYWIPQNLPTHTPTLIKKPTMQVLCPGCSKQLKLKSLINVRFTKVKIDSNRPKHRFMCPSCRKGLSNSSKVCALAKCAHALCLYCIKHFVAKDKQCPICEKKCKKKHVIPLKVGGTGFAASGAKYETKEFKPLNQG